SPSSSGPPSSQPNSPIESSALKRRYAIQLSDYETVKLNELIGIFIEETSLPVVKCANSIYEGLECAELYIRMVIRFCKRMSVFNSLDPPDQLALLKTFCFDAILIRYAFLFDFEQKGFPQIMVIMKIY